MILTFRSALLASIPALLAVVFGIAYLALRDEHQVFAQGPPGEGTVVEIRSRSSGGPAVRVQVHGVKGASAPVSAGRGQSHCEKTTARDLTLSVGQVVTLRHHRRSHRRVMLASDLDDARPSPWLLAGLAVSLGLIWVFLSAPGRARRRRLARTSGLDVIVDSLRRTRNLNLGLGITFVGCGVGLAAAYFSGAIADSGETPLWAVVFLLLLFGGSGGLLLVRGLKILSPRRSWILRVIEERPEQIEWIYQQVFTTEGIQASASYNVEIKLSGGRRFGLSVPGEDADLLLAELARRAPHADVGFSEELERAHRERARAARQPRP